MRVIHAFFLVAGMTAIACKSPSKDDSSKDNFSRSGGGSSRSGGGSGRPSGGGSNGSSGSSGSGGSTPPDGLPEDVLEACADMVTAFGSACDLETDLERARASCNANIDYAGACHDEALSLFECLRVGPFVCDGDDDTIVADGRCDAAGQAYDDCFAALPSGGGSGGSAGDDGGSGSAAGGGSGPGSGGSAGDGGSAAGVCTGVARSCATFPATPDACGGQSGCTLDLGPTTATFDDACQGEASACDAFFSEGSCDLQDGCVWQE